MTTRAVATTAALVCCFRCSAREHVSWAEVEHAVATEGGWLPRRPCDCDVDEVGVHLVNTARWTELDPLNILGARR